MNKKFSVLRIIGTLWKILAWIALVGGILLSVGVLLVGVLGSGRFLMQYLGQDVRAIPGAMGLVSSIVAFLIMLVISVIYFLVLYAVGDLIFLLLAIEENTRRTSEWIERSTSTQAEQPDSPPVQSP